MANTLNVFPELFRSGYVDTLQKNVRLFNESTGGAITLQAMDAEGHLVKDKFIERPTNVVSRATRGDRSDATVVDLTENEIRRPQIDNNVGPFELGQLEKMAMGYTDEEFSEELGQMVADDVFEDYVESLFSGIVGAIESESSNLKYQFTDASDNLKTAEPKAFNEGMGLFGDQRSDLSLMIMHSSVQTDLIDYGITSGDTPTVERGAIQGQPATVGKPFIPADLSALNSGSGHYTVIVRDGGAGVREVDQPELLESTVQFKNQGVTTQLGGDYRFNCVIRGFDWTGGDNPSTSDLSTSGNWNYVFSDAANAVGVIVETA